MGIAPSRLRVAGGVGTDVLQHALVLARYFADQQEVVLADAVGEFVNGLAEVVRRLRSNVAQRIDAKAVDVGLRDPVFVDRDHRAHHVRVAQLEHLQRMKVAVRRFVAFR